MKVSTPDILTAKEYHAFWIKWDNAGMVDVGRAGTVEPFMSYKDPTPFPISHYGLRTCWGATGKWKDHECKYIFKFINDHVKKQLLILVEYALQEGVAPPPPAVPDREDLEPPADHVPTPTPSPPSTPSQQPFHWVKAASGNIPEGAFKGGMDHGDQVLYIGRVWHQNVQLIGKVNMPLQGLRVCNSGTVLLFTDYEVLCGGPEEAKWVKNPGNGLPPNSVAGGRGSNGETYYVGRMNPNGTLTPGMVLCYLILYMFGQIYLHENVSILNFKVQYLSPLPHNNMYVCILSICNA